MDALYQIRITNISWQATEEDIKNFVNTFAKVTEVKLVLDYKKRSKGLAYITLADESSLNEALKEVERDHMTRKVKIVKAKPLSEKTDKERKPKQVKQTKKSETLPDAKPEQSKNKEQKQQRPQRKFSGQRKVRYTPKHNNDASIYVGNLSFRTTEMKLGRHFEKYGDIKNVRIIEDRETGKSKGFGYVEFESKEPVEKCLAENGSDLDGRSIRVAKVDTQTKRTFSNNKTQNNA